MTKMKVLAGACGFYAIIKAKALDKTKVDVQVVSGCKQVRSMNEDLGVIDWTKGIFTKICDSKIYQSANARLKHVDCPIPCAIVKAIQVEIGAAVPKGATIKFEPDEEDEEVYDITSS